MATETRTQYQEELDRLEASALDGLNLVSAALERTLEAIEHQDVELAQLVVADDDRIDGRYLEVHQSLITLLATQSPVATDLRLIDRKSTRLNSSHTVISYAVFCLKKKNLRAFVRTGFRCLHGGFAHRRARTTSLRPCIIW